MSKKKNLLSIVVLILLGIAGIIVNWASPAKSGKSFIDNAIVTSKNELPSALQDTPAKIKLITYNMGYASGEKNNKGHILSKEEVLNNLRMMAESLKKQNADVIALQEVDFFARRSFDIDQMKFIAEALEMPYSAFVVTWNKRYLPWPYWPPSRNFGRIISGQAILSRYPIKNQKAYEQEKPKNNAFWYNWFYLDRTFQHVTITAGQKEISLWNIHLEAFDEATRLSQTQNLINLLREKDNSLVFVLGDFNSTSFRVENIAANQTKDDSPQAVSLFIQQSGLNNAEPKNPVYTFPSWNPVKKIDHIFYGKTSKALGSDVIAPLSASDHLPVWAEFEL